MTRVPHLRIVVAFCLIAMAGYAMVTCWVIVRSGDVALIGDTVGTWKSFATLAVGFWLGSSSGGKAQPQEQG